MERDIHNPLTGRTLSSDEWFSALHKSYRSQVWVSIIAYFARVERPYYREEFLLQKEVAARKEIKAATQEDLPQQLDYTALFTSDPTARITGFCPVDHNKLVQMWTGGFNKLPAMFHTRVVFPHYNPRKNVSHATAGFYAQATGYSNNDLSVTTWDLLKHYLLTGEKIQGNMEFRVGWKLNDLKPRGYYCNGGTGYFHSEYIKPICNALQDILPSTNVFTRYDTSRLTVDFLSSTEFVVTYDYSSFTSSLAELKYFLFYLGSALKGETMTVLDVYLGLIEIDIGEYILEYNEVINQQAVVSTHRILERYTEDENHMAVDATDSEVFMTRNGPLGVPGNIGFSTGLHGINLAAFTDSPDIDSCVGDDALLRLIKTLFAPFIRHTNALGHINDTKASTIEIDLQRMDISEQQQYRYLKRPIGVDYFGRLYQGILLSFPGLAEIMNLFDPDQIRDVPDKPFADIAKAFSTQVGRFLSDLLQKCEQTLESEQEALLCILRRAYHMLGLPTRGAFPNTRTFFKSVVKGQLIPFVVPCLESDEDLEIFEYGWEYILCQHFLGTPFTTEMRSETRSVDYFYGKNSSFHGTSSPALEILVLMEYVEKKSVIIERIVGQDFGPEDLIALLLADSFVMFEFTQVVEELPSWYSDIVDKDFYHPLHNY